jgi:hypothetical protein
MPIQAGFGNGSFRTFGLTKRSGLERAGGVDYLIVAGGGGGGRNSGGGAGAGGVLTGVGFPVSSGKYTVTIGAGGTGAVGGGGSHVAPSNGVNSTFSSFGSAENLLVALGGGFGAGTVPGNPATVPVGYAASGGNGGGGYGQSVPGAPAGTTRGISLQPTNYPPNTSYPNIKQYGSNGGNGEEAGSYMSGGGGGAMLAGGFHYTSPGDTQPITGRGGLALESSISGTPTWYAGGGGGGRVSGAGELGGGTPVTAQKGGGGDGGDGSPGGTPAGREGGVNTGGGGGGAGLENNPTSFSGGAGGSGITILRYSKNLANAITTRIYTETSEYRIFTFDATGTITF